MARPLRLFFENACYHIISRGNRRENIFYSDKDRLVFLEKYSFICYSYCLMDNHYHLFIKTPHANISEGMHYLNASYTNWIKADHNIVGVIFRGRYKSILVDEDSYGIVLSSYIHLNPIRAGIVKELKEYKWSSYLDYLGKKESIDGLDTEFILKQFDEDIGKARRKYRAYVLKHTNMESPHKNLYRGFALGSEKYIEMIGGKISTIGSKREIKETRLAGKYSAGQIIVIMKKGLKLAREEILKKRRGNVYRQLALYLIKHHTGLSFAEIGGMFQTDYAAVSQATTRFKEVIERDETVRMIGVKIERELST